MNIFTFVWYIDAVIHPNNIVAYSYTEIRNYLIYICVNKIEFLLSNKYTFNAIVSDPRAVILDILLYLNNVAESFCRLSR